MLRRCAKACAFFSTLLLLSAGARGIRAQTSVTGAVKGFVQKEEDRSPIAEAKIQITKSDTGTSRSTVSAADGSYTISLLSPGKWMIKCTHPDFEPASHSVGIPLGRTLTLKVPPFILRRKTRQISGLDTPPPGDPSTDDDALEAADGRIVHDAPPRPAGDPQAASTAGQAAGPPPPQTVSTPPAEQAAKEEERQAQAAQMVNLDNAMRGGNFDGRFLSSLPLPGMRTFDSLALLVVGVVDPPQAIGDSSGPGIGAGIGTSGQFSVNGMRSRANNFTIDGSDNNDQDVAVRRQGFLALLPQSVESIQEFQIATLLWDADMGRNLGSQVNAITRTGTNRVRGELYGYLTDSRLNARNFFESTPDASRRKNPFTRSQAGATLAGPIARDRAHFFASYEDQRLRALGAQHFATPTESERRFQGLSSFKVLTAPDSFHGLFDYRIAGGATPLGLNLLSRPQHPLYPLPNDPSGPYGRNTLSRVLRASGSGDLFSIKTTHSIGTAHAVAARYSFADDFREIPSVKKAIDSSIDAKTRNHNVSVIVDSSLSPTVVQQARFSFGRTRLAFAEQPENPLSLADNLDITTEFSPLVKGTDSPFPGTFTFSSATGPIGELIVRPFSPVGIDSFLFPQGRVNNTFQFGDSISKAWQRHTVRFGADVRRVQLNSRQDRNYRPFIEVNNGMLDTVDGGRTQRSFVRGVEFASLGQISEIVQTISLGPPNSTIGLRFTELNLFVNENYRVRPNLTLNLGLRYEYNTVPRDVNGRIESALRLENLPKPGSTTVCGDDCKLYTTAFDEAVAAYRRIVDGRQTIYLSDRSNFGPHVGMAWDPRNNGTIALRAGYGVYYDTILGSVVSQSRNVFPSEVPFFSDSTFIGYDGLYANNPSFYGLPRGTTKPSAFYILEGSNQLGGRPDEMVALLGALFYRTRETGGLSFTLPEKDLRTPYVQHWHASVEKELFGNTLIGASYLGTKGTRLTRLTTPNGGRNVTPLQLLTKRNDAAPSVTFGDGRDRFVNQFEIRRGNPFLGPYQIFENSAGSIYHSMQLEARKRHSLGVAWTAAYVWSHAIDDVSDVVDTAGAAALAQDSRNLAAERANASFDVRHNFVASIAADLPFARARSGAAGAWLGDWHVSSIFRARTGQPFTLLVPFDANLDGNLTDRPSTAQGLVFQAGHRSQRVVMESGRGVEDFYVLRRNGVLGRNTARGDGLITWDLALSKKIRLKDLRGLELRTEAFNLLNRANFGLPVRIIGDPGFGASVETVTPARTIQFALKLVF